MKKIKLFIAALVLASAVVAISINARTSNDPFFKANLEALSDTEDSQGVLKRGYVAGERWIVDGVVVSIPPAFSFNFVSIVCCIESSQMNGCDFSMADVRCGL